MGLFHGFFRRMAWAVIYLPKLHSLISKMEKIVPVSQSLGEEKRYCAWKPRWNTPPRVNTVREQQERVSRWTDDQNQVGEKEWERAWEPLRSTIQASILEWYAYKLYRPWVWKADGKNHTERRAKGEVPLEREEWDLRWEMKETKMRGGMLDHSWRLFSFCAPEGQEGKRKKNSVAHRARCLAEAQYKWLVRPFSTRGYLHPFDWHYGAHQHLQRPEVSR